MKRRTFLRGSTAFGATVSLSLPVLHAMLNPNGDALAAGENLPCRLGVYHWGCGVVHSTWVPSSTGTGWPLPPGFADWAGLEQYLTLVSGYNHKNTSPGHIPARGIALSASHDLNTGIQGVGTYRGQNHPEPSVDNIVANAWKGTTALDHLAVGINGAGPYQGNSSWLPGGQTYNRHEMNPSKVWQRLFSQGLPSLPSETDSPSTDRADIYQASMLDAVIADASALSRRLGATDRHRMEQHLEGLRSIERRIQSRLDGRGGRGTPTESCSTPDIPSDTSDMEEKSRLMSDMVAAALACDLVRVFSYEWSANQSEAVYGSIENKAHHDISHDAATGDSMKAIQRFILKNWAYLARTLRDMPEGDGNLLDNTLIFGTSEHANPGTHDYDDHPLAYVGKAGGRLRGGLHVRGDGSEKAQDGLLTAVRAVGVQLAALGQEQTGRRTSRVFSDILI